MLTSLGGRFMTATVELADSGPVVRDDAALRSFLSHDGVELKYRSWLPSGAIARGIVLIHRGHEHSARMDYLAEALAEPGTAIFAWDARGHGQSPGERGHAENFSIVVRDLDWFVRHLS